MTNKIITEVSFINQRIDYQDYSYTLKFPTLDQHLSDNWIVKSITHLPVCTVNKGHIDAISITVLLEKA